MLTGLTFSIFGFVVYYLIPFSILNRKFSLFFFFLLGILVVMVVGMILLAQLLIPYLEKFMLSLMIKVRGRKDRHLESIIRRNLDSHGPRNMKASMMFTITVTFLIFYSTCFAENEYILLSLAHAIVGADVALYRATFVKGNQISLEEAKLKTYFAENTADKGGLVTGYGFLGWNLNELC